MGKIKNGFTLIELLAVVLIIGILAAIALPQYTISVEKSKAAEGLTNLKSLIQASEIYYLENGQYPELADWDALVIQFPGEREYYASIDGDVWKSGDWRYYLSYGSSRQVWARMGKAGEKYYFSYNPTAKEYLCGVYKTEGSKNPKLYEKICAAFCGNNNFTEGSDRATCKIK
jgi:type II secretion system protein G